MISSFSLRFLSKQRTFNGPMSIKVFDELKSYLGSPPLLNKLELDEELHLYLAISFIAISLILVSKGARL